MAPITIQNLMDHDAHYLTLPPVIGLVLFIKVKSNLIILDKKNPGPGEYNLEAISRSGKYTNSKLKSAAGGKFYSDCRIPKYASPEMKA